uniref:Uncharacterized protein n=1 Tax=uncultured Acetothermia bacterium TaxID=236499 RepID=H5SDH9_9BACT|nr:hypothetical protein HGMM_F13E04C11 [uncultured Acetothermia bacterium]
MGNPHLKRKMLRKPHEDERLQRDLDANPQRLRPARPGPHRKGDKPHQDYLAHLFS